MENSSFIGVITNALRYRPFKQASCPVVIQVMNTSYVYQSKNEIVTETFLFCSIEGFRFPGFMKHNKLKFSSGLEFFRCFASAWLLKEI